MSKPTEVTYRFVGTHLDDLADGRPLVPGQTVSLNPGQAEQPHTARHIDEGRLIPVETKKESDS